MLLGQKIFIDDNEVIKEELEKIEEKNREYTEQELKNKIKEKYKTVKEWISLNYQQKQKIKIFGLGLMAIARKFGVEGNPVKLHKVHLLLGQKIYVKDNEVIKEELKKIEEKELAKIEEKDNKKYTLEELKKEILIQFPTAKDWAGLTKAQKQKIKIFGLGLKAIATKFEVEGKPVNSHKDHLFLGQEIYGINNEVIKEELKRADEGYSFQELKDEIFEQFPTVKDWVKLTSKQRQEIKIFGFGLLAIATKFGVEGNPVGIHKDHLLLGQEIYGINNEVIKEELKKYTKQNLES